MSVKRLRWGAVLLGLLLATSWAGAAQADTTDTTVDTTVDTTATTVGATTTTVGATTTTVPEPGGNEPCSVADGLASHSAISVDDASAHPSASASFTVKEGCEVIVFLASGKVSGDTIEEFDFAPSDAPPLFGPGDHTLTVRLPDCSDFIVDFVGFKPEPEPVSAQALMSSARSDAAQTLSEGEGPGEDPVLDEVTGTTTNCPTQTTNGEAVTTTSGSDQLPFTGTNAMPILIAGLVLVAGGAVAVLASRARSRQAK
jgi:hypothetical protein